MCPSLIEIHSQRLGVKKRKKKERKKPQQQNISPLELWCRAD